MVGRHNQDNSRSGVNGKPIVATRGVDGEEETHVATITDTTTFSTVKSIPPLLEVRLTLGIRADEVSQLGSIGARNGEEDESEKFRHGLLRRLHLR